MSLLVVRTEVREGLWKFQTRVDVRHEEHDDFDSRRVLATAIALKNTPVDLTVLVDVPGIRWAINTDFMPGFFMSMEWYAEEVDPA